MSLPAILKIYLERTSVTDLTFGYSEKGAMVGLCRVFKLLYITTRGGNYAGIPMETATSVLKALCTMYGIPEFQCPDAEGLDDIRNDKEALLADAVRRAEVPTEMFWVRSHVLLLTTGGTIASPPTAEGLVPGLDGETLAGLLPQGIMDCYDITIRDVLHLDSSSIQPEEWQTIARHVFENRTEYSGIVIIHGADTMAYTTSVFSFVLWGTSIPVALTEAQLPMAHPLSDGIENPRTALAMAAPGVLGVFLAFDRKMTLDYRAVKTHTTDFDASENVNQPLAANVDGKGLQTHRGAIPAPAGARALQGKLCDKTFPIKLIPGLDPEIFDMLLQMHYRGIVIEAFGAEGLHFVRRDLIAKPQAAVRAGMTVAVYSQCLYEPNDLSVYEAGQRTLVQEVIQDRDMTTEAAVTKFMWVLGQTGDPEIIRDYMERSLAGEMV